MTTNHNSNIELLIAAKTFLAAFEELRYHPNAPPMKDAAMAAANNRVRAARAALKKAISDAEAAS
jgi:hypothetical protein